MKVKWYSEMEMAQENDYSQRESFYWVVSWPLLLSGGELTFQEDKNLMEEVYWGKFFQMGGMSKFSASGGTTTMPTVGKTLWSIICTVIKLSIKNLFTGQPENCSAFFKISVNIAYFVMKYTLLNYSLSSEVMFIGCSKEEFSVPTCSTRKYFRMLEYFVWEFFKKFK